MSFASTLNHIANRLALVVLVVTAIAAVTPMAAAQSALSIAGQVRSAFPQSPLAEPAAAVARTCSSISSLSRRCFFTFYKECEKRGDSKEHCARMSGFCHACTDAYATCKGSQTAAKTKSNAATTNCATCNVAYGRCIGRMVEQYGGKLIKAK
jgi:hypothetical protein